MKNPYNHTNAVGVLATPSQHVLIHDVARQLCLPTYAIKRLMEQVREFEINNKAFTSSTELEDEPLPGYMSHHQIAQVEAILYRLTHTDSRPSAESKTGQHSQFGLLRNNPFLDTLPSQSELYRQLMVSQRGAIN